MTIRFATEQEIVNWNEHILANLDGGNIAQSIELANIKSQTGWRIRLLITDICAMTVHERYVPAIGKLWYIPKGPGVEKPEDISKLLRPLHEFARKQGVFVVKIEPEIIKSDEAVTKLAKLGLAPSHPIQPNSSTVILDLSKNIDDIMADLPQKARHAIKRAYRDGLETVIAEPTDKNFDIMVNLIHQTMADKSVVIRSSSYYKNFWKSYIKSGMGALFFAYQDDKPIAGAFVQIFGKKGTYKDGGSVREKTIYGASHALQWCVIEWLVSKGVKSYDLCGSPPAAEIGNKNHPHYGIGLFKTGFNKAVTEYVGVHDIVIRPFAYKIWASFGERVICRIYAIFMKKLFY